MPKYRKKALVDAEQYQGPTWVAKGAAFEGPAVPAGVEWVPTVMDGQDGTSPAVQTNEGRHWLRPGDWIVTNPSGKRYNVSDEEFRDTYVLAETPVGIPSHPQDKRDCDPPIRCGALVNDEGRPDSRGRACDADKGHPEGKHHYPESPYELGYAGI